MNIQQLLHNYQSIEVKPDQPTTSEWQDIVEVFTELANRNRGQYPAWNYKRTAAAISPIYQREGIGFLRYFYDKCQKAKNPAAFFKWSVSSKNVNV